jgi:arsenite-transporting ATPase
MAAFEPSLENVASQQSLRWVFVGGKGGVGKTTTSCCLGVQLAARRRKVLIVSTDPAHNLSDAFNQKFTRAPTLVEGFSNLYCMEIDPAAEIAEGADGAAEQAGSAAGGPGGAGNMMAGFLKEFSSSIPGIDELMSFGELMKTVQSMDYDVTVFDTAPTGHTLRLLSLPGMVDKLIGKVLSMRGTISTVMASVNAMTGGAGAGLPSEELIMGKLDELKATIDAVQERIHNVEQTTFVCVCIPEFLSLYETERLVQELSKFEIDTHNIVVNQVLFPCGAEGAAGAAGAHGADRDCSRCAARMRMQKKYLDQIALLYEDLFHIVRTPLLNEEVRGAEKLRAFGRYLLAPYDPAVPLPAVLL